MDDDIRQLAESVEGLRFKQANSARWAKRNAAIHSRHERKLMSEQERHFKAIKAMDDERYFAEVAAREAHYDAEREFFIRKLESLRTPPEPASQSGGD